MQVLAVDDNKSNCVLLGRYLKKWGYEPCLFTDSREAYELMLNTAEPLVALVDWMMPEMSGIDICEKIRAERPNFPLYIILLTAKSDENDIVKGLGSGADDYIPKPFNPRELRSRIASGRRIIRLEEDLLVRERELKKANERLKKSLHRIEAEIDAGKKVQFAMLPPNNIHYDDYFFCHYLKPSAKLSGDFLDYFWIDEHRLGFYFIDVAGHGSFSAFITVHIKCYITSFIEKQDRANDIFDHPDDFIANINRMVLEEGLGKHLTLFYGIIDTRSNHMIYSNGGQFPFPILKQNQKTDFLCCQSLPVGVVDDAPFTRYEQKLSENFDFYLFSDGILEILPPRNLREKQQYLLQKVSSFEGKLEQLIQQLGLHEQDELPDDVAIFKIKRGSI